MTPRPVRNAGHRVFRPACVDSNSDGIALHPWPLKPNLLPELLTSHPKRSHSRAAKEISKFPIQFRRSFC